MDQSQFNGGLQGIDPELREQLMLFLLRENKTTIWSQYSAIFWVFAFWSFVVGIVVGVITMAGS